MKWFWNAHITGWRIYGVWFKHKLFIGFSITQEGVSSPEASSLAKGKDE